MDKGVQCVLAFALDSGKYANALSALESCSAWVLAVLARAVWNKSKNAHDRRRWLLLLLFAADD
eukprot:6179092-Pleurochrysis_carterae.AAC.1